MLGGGVFGVLQESNWEVCEQTPAAGEPLTEAPRLQVERNCNKDDASSSEEPSPEPEADGVLTVDNNGELTALLSGPATGETVDGFLDEYRGQVVQFDGFVADAYINLREHNGQSTIRVMAGDASDPGPTGPVFQLGWYSHESPLEEFAKGDKVRVTALVGMVYEFDPHQFFLVEDEGANALAPR